MKFLKDNFESFRKEIGKLKLASLLKKKLATRTYKHDDTHMRVRSQNSLK